MTDSDKKYNEKEQVQNIPHIEKPTEVLEEKKEVLAEKEQLPKEEVQRIREQLEQTDIDDSLKPQAAASADDIASLEDEKKITKLLDLAKSKGVQYAVQVAKKMDDYVLDKFHDKLVEKGFYKQFTK